TRRTSDPGCGSLAQQPFGSLLSRPAPFFDNRRAQFVTLAARHAVPAIYPFREYVQAGGLMSYGASFIDTARLAGVYTARVLKGQKPAELPVLPATKVEIWVNLQTGKMMGLTVAPTRLARADEVIE